MLAVIPHRSLCHKNLGWLTAPDGVVFASSESGKMIYLCDNRVASRGAAFHYPYGTAWRASSIIACAD